MDPEKVQKYLEDIEQQAESILTDQQEIIALDRRRNTNREALRKLNSPKNINNSNSKSKHWICIGNMFIRLPKEYAAESIQKGNF